MSNDKIEIICPYCQSVLRVEAIHAGKKLRCPSCNSITLIPGSQVGTDQPAYRGNPEPNDRPNPRQNPVQTAAGGNRYYAPQEPPAQEYSNLQRDRTGNYAPTYNIEFDGRDSTSLALGIIGIVLNIFCSCMLPGIVIMNAIGFAKGYQSRGPLRTAGMITNGISLGISLLRLLVFVVRGIF